MIIKVIGKRVVNRTSYKTGKHVDGCVVHARYDDERVTGIPVEAFWVDSKFCNPESILLGQKYSVAKSGDYVVKFSPVPKTHRRALLSKIWNSHIL
jgi:hypothetical protein